MGVGGSVDGGCKGLGGWVTGAGYRGAGGGGGDGGIGEGKMCEVGCGQQRQKTPNRVRGTRKRAGKNKNKNRKWVKKISRGGVIIN